MCIRDRFRSDAPDGLEQRMQQQSGAYTAHPTSRDDVCLIAFTSGTTGKPKGTMHFHRDVLAMCDLFPRHILQMNENDVVCGTPPIAFTFGLGGLLAFPLRFGASTVLLEKHTPETLMQTIAKYRATQCYTAPTMYRQMATLAKGVDLSSLKHPVSAGEALPDATRQLWKQATGIEMTDGIGGTEVIHIYISSAGTQVRPGSIGQVAVSYTHLIALHGVSDFNKGGGDFSWTYAQLQDKSNRIAQVLTQDMGLLPGNRILLRGGNSPMTVSYTHLDVYKRQGCDCSRPPPGSKTPSASACVSNLISRCRALT